MKNSVLIIIFSTLVIIKSLAQGLTKNAKGEGSVLFKGNHLTLDVAESKISFGLNNLQNKFGDNCGFVWGINANGKNESGITGLIGEGTVVPNASLNGFIGVSISNGIPKALNNRLDKELASYRELLEKLDIGSMEDIKKTILMNTLGDDLKKLRENQLKALENALTQGFYIDNLKNFKSDEGTSDEIQKKEKSAIEKITISGKRILANVEKQQDKLSTDIQNTENEINTSNFFQHIIYLSGGAGSTSFKLVPQIKTPFSDSFIDTTFKSRNIGLGANFLFKNIIIGVSYKYVLRNNLSTLKEKVYIIRTKSTNDNQSLIEESKVSAYPVSEKKPYLEIPLNELNFDIVFNRKLDDKSKNLLLINPYINAQVFSRNKLVIPNNLSIGCGLYYYKESGKFLGGIYFELPDVSQAYEKLKPVDDQKLLAPYKRVVIGLTGQMTIGSFLNLF
ncbi:hypothetical protein [Runella salmonicolor]|uniref:Outer membrane protein beta-barrel domain-containing protein n=1 Tax=Runella salmonicolor TaxID=2950278 RepID=A0ABT1FS51_9BACT|nr:hypothetical protein [Runella salmonicolor]MCP1384595.1 hypothetical protein [Runella salmonicolor]